MQAFDDADCMTLRSSLSSKAAVSATEDAD